MEVTTRPIMTAKDSPDTLAQAIGVFLSKPQPLIFFTTAIVMLGYRLTLEGSWWEIVPVVLMLIGWPFMEWGIHIHILHAKPGKLLGKPFYSVPARKHRAHHKEPWRLDLIFLPMFVLFAIPLVSGLAFLLMPTAMAASFCAAAFYCVVQYEWVHFIVHTRVKPKTKLAKTIFLNHRMHHFRNERYWYSFSVPWVDKYYGTGPDSDAVEVSSGCRDLGIPDNWRVSSSHG